jgi:phosphoserine phosphatase
LAGLPESVIQDALAEIKVTRGAEDLIDKIHSTGGFVGAVSGGFTQILTPLAKMLNLDFYRANQLEITDGRLSGEVLEPIIDKPAKAIALKQWADEVGIPLQDCVAIGDGANDLDMMAAAGLSIGFNAKPRVRAAANLLIDSGDLSDAIELIGL